MAFGTRDWQPTIRRDTEVPVFVAGRDRVEPRAIPGAGLRERLNRDGAALDA